MSGGFGISNAMEWVPIIATLVLCYCAWHIGSISNNITTIRRMLAFELDQMASRGDAEAFHRMHDMLHRSLENIGNDTSGMRDMIWSELNRRHPSDDI